MLNDPNPDDLPNRILLILQFKKLDNNETETICSEYSAPSGWKMRTFSEQKDNQHMKLHKIFERKAWQQRSTYVCVVNVDERCSGMFLQGAAEQMKGRNMSAWGGRRLAFHWALASHVVGGAVVHLQLPPWLRKGVHCGRGGHWRAVVGLYMHLKVGRSGETWDQKNRRQGSCLTTRGGPAVWRQSSVRYHDWFDEENFVTITIN